MAVALGDMRMSSNNRPDLYSFFQPKITEAIVNSITTDGDADGGRRKRQRTASPPRQTLMSTSTVSYAWQDQLQIAAYEESTNLDKVQKPTTTTPIQDVQHVAKGQEALVVDGPKSTNIPEKKALKKNGLCTPPKKILKIRPDGKLVSPKYQDTASKPAGAVKKKSKSEGNLKQMIVVLKYGEDEESRNITAQKIQEICLNIGQKKSENLGTAKHNAVKVESLKPTHPFFLAPVARVSDHRPSADEIDFKDRTIGGNDQLQRAKHGSKQISAVQKPGVGAGAWASVGGFGGKPFVPGNPRLSRFPGAIDPILPPQGMVHIGRQIELESNIPEASDFLRTGSKMKDVATHIPEREEFLQPYAALVKSCGEEKNRLHNATCCKRNMVRHPFRRIMTGPELQQAIRQNISCRLPVPRKLIPVDCKEENFLDSARSDQGPVHKAVLQVYEEIESSLTAFDKFDCETLDWVHKYAPRSAEQVLQQGREAMHLRDWLQRLTVTSVENRNPDAKKDRYSHKHSGLNSRKKRQKKPGDLEGFVISSDDEAAQMDELADPELDELSLQDRSYMKRSVLRAGDVPSTSDNTGSGGRATNAVVISGPHGCGKTAAVYAVAKETNFEVFEITAGSRRSGKDLLEKVGDMARNHLVTRAHESKGSDGDECDKANENALLISDALKKDLESGRQGTMKSFFQPKPEGEKRPKPRARNIKTGLKSKGKLRKPPTQKQSLILLEEVDVLFEEDRQFWVTTLELILQSKRPIIMTCTDESLLPLADLPLHAILRFTPPSEPLATDYLSLIACSEGHLLSRQAVSALYRCKGYDLRASITELNFFCQMAVGDTKGGLEWMLLRSSPQECRNENGEILRVVSEGTYLEGMGWVTCDNQNPVAGNRIDKQSDILGDVLEGWSMVTGDRDEISHRKPLTPHGQVKRDETLKMLEALDQAFDALSAADTYPRLGGRHGCSALLDPTQPPLTEKFKVNFVEGSTLLQADPLLDPTNLATSFALALTVCATSVIARGDVNQSAASLNRNYCIDMILENAKMLRSQTPVTRSSLSAAFSPITSSPKALSKGPHISSFENTKSVVVEEVAPYVRSIVSYDMRLEEQRLRLSSLLSEGARNGKRIRTTRASRAALEGGSKANTRRERWFPENTNLLLVLQTGGSGWQSIALQRAMYTGSDRGDEDTAPEALCQASVASTVDGEAGEV